MNPCETKTLTATDGVPFVVDVWSAHESPRARIVMLHGIRSHAGWYAGSCAKLAAAGYRVLFIERRGAGRNQVQRGDAPNFRTLCTDVKQVIDEDQKQFPALQTTIIGISWGAKIALATALLHPETVQRLVFIAPGFAARVQPSLRDRLRILLARLTQPTKQFPIPLNDADLFTRNESKQAYLRTNPHDLHHATARFLVLSKLLDRYLKLRFAANKLPTLTLLSGEDRVIDNDRVRALVTMCPHGNIIDYPGYAHTLEFEDEALKHIDDVAQWLADQPKRPRM